MNENISVQEKFEGTEIFVEEELDFKKKKERDLKDFERMLEEQMLLESKRLEEKGIDINETSKKPNKNFNKFSKNYSKNKNSTLPSSKNQKEDNFTENIEKENIIEIQTLKISQSKSNLDILKDPQKIHDDNISKIENKDSKKNNINKPIDKKQTSSNLSKNRKENDSSNNIEKEKENVKQERDFDEDEEKFSKLNKEEIEIFVNKLIGKEAEDLLNSDKWNERKEGFLLVNEYINMQKESNNLQILKSNLENILIFLKIKLKGFKENNFNILREAFNIYIELIKLFAIKKAFDRKTCTGILKAYWEKFSEIKVKESLSNLFFTMMEYYTPNFILTFLAKNLNEKTRSPALLKEYAQFFERVIDEFGISTIPLKDIVEFCKNLSSNTNPQVRISSTSLLCIIYKYIGKDLKTLLIKDIKESTYKIIEAELDKVTVIEGSSNQTAKRNVISDNCEKVGAINGNVLDSLIPRVDISKKITPKIIKDLNEGKWGDKKSAFESIEKILSEANNKILPNGLNDLFLTVFKTKLNDANKNVVRMMVQLISKLIDSLGTNFKSMPNGIFKNITPLLIANLADKMLLLREDVLICMEKWTLNSGIENILIYIPEQLKIDNFELRTDLFKYLSKYKHLIDKSPTATQILKEYVNPILKCLQDKTQQIRTCAEDFIIFSLKYLPISHYFAGIKDYKPAIQNHLKKLLEAAHLNYSINVEKEMMPRENCNINIKNENNYLDENNETNNNANLPSLTRDLKNGYNNNENLINLNIESNLNTSKFNIEKNLHKIEKINNIDSFNDSIILNNKNNFDENLKQDSKISKINKSLSNESLIITDQFSKIENKKIQIKTNSKINLLTNEKSIEKIPRDKADINLNYNKTPEAIIECNPYQNTTPDKQNISNFAACQKSKTPIGKADIQKNINVSKTNKNNNLNSININNNLNTTYQEEILNTNNNNSIACNNNIIDHNFTNSNNDSFLLQNDSKSFVSNVNINGIGISPRITGKTSNNQLTNINKKNLGLQSYNIFQQNISIKLSKEKRFELDKKNKFNLDAPSDEYVNKLKENLNQIFIPEYVQKLLNDDIKNNVEAINLVINYISDFAPQNNYTFLDYIDVYLKWIIWKININQNPSIIKALLEFFELLAEIFIKLDNRCKLNDIEIYITINCLSEKLGNSNEKIREQAKELLLFKYMKFLIPIQKSTSEICNIVANTNKNTKMRIECLDILNFLNSDRESNIFYSKDIKSLIKTYIIAKNGDTFKNKLQDFLFNFLYQNQENILSLFTELDPKTKDSLNEKLNIWIKNKNNIITGNSTNSSITSNNKSVNVNSNNKLNKNFVSSNGINTSINLTPRVNPSNESLLSNRGNSNKNHSDNSKNKNTYSKNNPLNKENEHINKTDCKDLGDNKYTLISGHYTSRIENQNGKTENFNGNLSNLNIAKKNSLSPINNINGKNKQNNYLNTNNYHSSTNKNEDLNYTTKLNKSRNVISNIKNVNINYSMDESQNISIINTGKKTNSSKQVINKKTDKSSLSSINNNPDLYNYNNLNDTIIKNKTYNLEDREDLMNILDNLINGNDTEKLNTILIIHDIIHAKFEASKHILIPNIDEVIKTFIISLQNLFEKAHTKIEEIPVKLGKYLITVLYKISSNRELIKNISYDILFELTEEVLSNLLLENLDKIGENQEGLVIIRSLNSTMLRVLENCDYTQVIEMLLDIVMKYRNSQDRSKISGLGIKCLLKIHQILEQIINEIRVDKLLLKIHLIFCEFDKSIYGLEPENQTDQMIIRFIKNFIYELVKIKKEEIVIDYRLVEKNIQNDKYIKKWIKSILSSFENEKTDKYIVVNNKNNSEICNNSNNKEDNIFKKSNNNNVRDNYILKNQSPNKVININNTSNSCNNTNSQSHNYNNILKNKTHNMNSYLDQPKENIKIMNNIDNERKLSVIYDILKFFQNY